MELDYQNPGLRLDQAKSNLEGRIGWESPSNIAIIKYWGKYGDQLPRNPSLSFTLSNSVTRTWLDYAPRTEKEGGEKISLKFYFENELNAAFGKRVEKFLLRLLGVFPFLGELDLEIHTENTFPHSSGIASSASGMSALAMCLCSLEQKLFGTPANEEDFLKKASYIARLGSGSACRSVYPELVAWGTHSDMPEASDFFAVRLPKEQIHPVFSTFHDDILIVSKGVKKVSSSVGHGLMDGNIYAENRYFQARQGFSELLTCLKNGDIHGFGKIAESEALTLHALMMTSSPPFVLMEPESLAIIQHIQNFRAATGLPLYFTLDAGPNIHLLYPEEVSTAVGIWLNDTLLPTMGCIQIIRDKTGQGPRQLS